MKLIYVGLITILVPLSSCTLMEMNKESTAMESRIPQKELWLNSINQQNQVLAQQTQSLTAQRKVIEAEFNDLSTEFQQLQNDTAGLKAKTSAQKQQLKRKKAETLALQKRIKDAQNSPQTTENDLKRKQELIKGLKDEIRTRLNMGLRD